MPKTDCCNICLVFTNKKKQAARENNEEVLTQLEIDHTDHLNIAAARRTQMEIDFAPNNNVVINNTVLEHDLDGSILQIYGPANIILIFFLILYLLYVLKY